MEWRDIKGYEGIYEVSNTGLVRSHKDKTTTNKHGKVKKWNQIILKQKVGSDNCCRVNLHKDRKAKTFLIHRLVAFAFLEKPEGKDFVNHIDGNRLNNHLSNLEWCNYTENNNHAFDNRLIKTSQQIKLINIVTKEEHIFRSKAKASEFLGKNNGFVSYLILKGVKSWGNFEIKEIEQ
jgi:hypothetical protein